MKGMARIWLLLVWIILLATVPIPGLSYATSATIQEPVTKWQMLWVTGSSLHTNTQPDATLESVLTRKDWMSVEASQPILVMPKGVHSAWMKVKLPSFQLDSPSIFIPKLYAHNLSIYAGDRLIYNSNRGYDYDTYKILLPLNPHDSGQELYIRAETLETRIGISEAMVIGDYQVMMRQFIARNLDDIILGAAYILISLIMLVCSIFLKRPQMSSWISLNLIILSIGILVITYSPFLYSVYENYGRWFVSSFDLALFALFPGLCYFFESIFGIGIYGLIRKCRIFFTCYSMLCAGFLAVNLWTELRWNDLYYMFSVTIMGIFMLITLLLLLSFSVVYAYRGSRDAMVFAAGFSIMTLTEIGELFWFYVQKQNYEFYLWKWGVFGFVLSLIVLLGRQLARNHDRVVQYSKELELYNHQIQRSEKMQIISELAASVAHEVRNPLQVTRGFLQMLTNRSAEAKDKQYFNMAIEELDRASTIITDFLTFAKPQLEHVTLLNLNKEFEQIDGIMAPMANLQGVEIRMDIPEELQINGNSSKLKQAFINMIKNSIEASPEDGLIRIWAYREKGEAVLHILDNGEGMEAHELSKLGEPYFSTKTKGTGLGLMVTFRIIEVMQGSIRFISEKGNGTEAIIRFPLAREQSPL